MGNVYYRYPKWRVSPYAGFGLGAFFHDGTVTSTVTIENLFPLGGIFLVIIYLTLQRQVYNHRVNSIGGEYPSGLILKPWAARPTKEGVHTA